MIATGPSALLSSILPSSVVAAEAYGDLRDVWTSDDEMSALAAAVTTRRAEFVTARACARSALAQAGVMPAAIPVGSSGAPVWPQGIVGSITHCSGYRGAAVARRGKILAIGIDAESDSPIADDLAVNFCSESELLRARLVLDIASKSHAGRLLFSAKEAVYKAWSTFDGGWLDFMDVSIDFAWTGRFGATLADGAVDSARVVPRSMGGGWCRARGLILTAVVITTTG